MNLKAKLHTDLQILTISSIVLLVSACAGVPKPIGEMASAKTAIESAIRVEASEYAAVELDRAQNKLSRANAEMKKDNNNEARRLAEQALIEAEYASAKSITARISTGTKEMEDSIRMLEERINK